MQKPTEARANQSDAIKDASDLDVGWFRSLTRRLREPLPDAARFVPLRAKRAIDHLVERSQHELVIVFQHDPHCPISRRAYRELAGLSVEAALVDVAQDRHIRQTLAEHTRLPHESPPVLVFHAGWVIYSASHFEITRRTILSVMSEYSVDGGAPIAAKPVGVVPLRQSGNGGPTVCPSLVKGLRSAWDNQ